MLSKCLARVQAYFPSLNTMRSFSLHFSSETLIVHLWPGTLGLSIGGGVKVEWKVVPALRSFILTGEDSLAHSYH